MARITKVNPQPKEKQTMTKKHFIAANREIANEHIRADAEKEPINAQHSQTCKGTPRYYDGALGYEAMKCERCGYELDLNAQANAKATAERLAQHSPLPTWTDQARNAIRLGQSLNEFILHCHPHSRKEARKAYMCLIKIEKLKTKAIKDACESAIMPYMKQGKPELPTHEIVQTDTGVRIDPTNARFKFAQLERQELADVRKQRDHYKAHADKLAEALRDCLAAYSGDNYYDIEGKVAAAQEAREVLDAYESEAQS